MKNLKSSQQNTTKKVDKNALKTNPPSLSKLSETELEVVQGGGEYMG